ncbi:biotin transporter BioY [Bacillus smithii]|nr:biotin transporter BioY [Bacillus smithii]MED1454919.1 biotin transporter BioY [Bacillus smithii]
MMALFAALMMIGANITSFAPFMVINGVPITLQTVFAVLAGAVLGKRLGAISMTVYALIGIIGVPVSAQFKGGFETIFSPTFGFILSFILAAYITGWIIEKKKTQTACVIASLAGMAANYLFGTNWMYMAMKLWADAPPAFSYKAAWLTMLVPLPKDILLSVFAGFLAYRLERTVLSKSKLRNQNV